MASPIAQQAEGGNAVCMLGERSLNDVGPRLVPVKLKANQITGFDPLVLDNPVRDRWRCQVERINHRLFEGRAEVAERL
jgi:hypothetical protein